ncbi:hypothetical protein EIP91_002814 [Steccherinum ochraceum]|uniref:DUF6533 domain-containing protein n=1 Tax=Steccherinum ochraceum TaxID=92696 RepID=A0A4R0RN96_9APHY|nr:hypothetical protein EIP91_002814 [Steccherinum ochraceum]
MSRGTQCGAHLDPRRTQLAGAASSGTKLNLMSLTLITTGPRRFVDNPSTSMSNSSSLDFSLACQFAVLSFIVYETLLGLSREVKYIWRRKFSCITVIFVSQRWLTVLYALVILLPTPHLWVCMTSLLLLITVLTHLIQGCQTTLILRAVLEQLVNLGTAAFSTLRIWAIWQHALPPTLAVFFTSAAVPVINFYTSSQIPHSAITSEEGSCFSDYMTSHDVSRIQPLTRRLGQAARGAAIASDLLVLALTWIKTVGMWRTSRKIDGFRPTLSMLLIRDGTLYFGVLLIMNLLALLPTNAVQNNSGAFILNSFIVITDAISASMVARFILDLRSVNNEDLRGFRTTTTSLNFGAYTGNIGAPLGDSMWTTDPAEDIANECHEQSENEVVLFGVVSELKVGVIPPETAMAVEERLCR